MPTNATKRLYTQTPDPSNEVYDILL